jgi:hypothetical protein
MLIVHSLIHIQYPEIFTRNAGKRWISIHNRPEDLGWVELKVCWLPEQAGVRSPPIVIE